MKILILLFILTSCFQDGEDGVNGTNGKDGKNGADGKDGTRVVKIESLEVPGSNICTYYPGEFCYFNGGQLITYSDDSRLLMGAYSYEYNNGELDRLFSSVTMMVPPGADYAWQRLDWDVSREGPTGKSLFLVLKIYSWGDRVYIYYDSNSNNVFNENDDAIVEFIDLSTEWQEF
jgi:hypothetical protein